jgi:hypothetical protein
MFRIHIHTFRCRISTFTYHIDVFQYHIRTAGIIIEGVVKEKRLADGVLETAGGEFERAGEGVGVNAGDEAEL